MNIMIENLAPEITNEKLEKIFSEFGFVEYVHISNISGEPFEKATGFVEMPIKAQAYSAVKNLDGVKLLNNIVKVQVFD